MAHCDARKVGQDAVAHQQRDGGEGPGQVEALDLDEAVQGHLQGWAAAAPLLWQGSLGGRG